MMTDDERCTTMKICQNGTAQYGFELHLNMKDDETSFLSAKDDER